MVAPKRADGLMAGDSSAQVVPFHVQVSASDVPLELKPPNRTMSAVAGSKAIVACERPVGLVAGDSSVQVVPFHTHVSVGKESSLPRPPKRSI
jgi:hypothetical protein